MWGRVYHRTLQFLETLARHSRASCSHYRGRRARTRKSKSCVRFVGSQPSACKRSLVLHARRLGILLIPVQYNVRV